jgi:hypothetical protein
VTPDRKDLPPRQREFEDPNERVRPLPRVLIAVIVVMLAWSGWYLATSTPQMDATLGQVRGLSSGHRRRGYGRVSAAGQFALGDGERDAARANSAAWHSGAHRGARRDLQWPHARVEVALRRGNRGGRHLCAQQLRQQCLLGQRGHGCCRAGANQRAHGIVGRRRGARLRALIGIAT